MKNYILDVAMTLVHLVNWIERNDTSLNWNPWLVSRKIRP